MGAFDCLVRRWPLRLGELVRIGAGGFEDMIGPLVELLGRKVRTQVEAGALEPA